MSERVRKDGIIMRHVAWGREHHWQAVRGDVRSSWFADDGRKTGYQRAIDDLLVIERMDQAVCA